jgi:predicted alpha-1,2-mannosidase
MHPERSAHFVNSMLDISEQGGMLPVWHLMGCETGTMVGLSGEQIVAEAYLKGIKGIDGERVFAELEKSAMSDYRGMNYVRDLKYIPAGEGGIRESVAMAMELAVGDASIAQVAKAMGKTEDYEYFSKRAELYKLYWDENTGFFRGRFTDGTFNPLFDPMKTVRPWIADYTEGSAWHYLWLVPHDVDGLTELIGGEERFVQRLDSLFTLQTPEGESMLADVTGLIGQYAHGNEPSHHVAYLYAYAGQQWKTARLVRQIMKEFYNDTPDGLIGNEDCGQMSAWYVLSAMGFYPVFTASCDYVIGSPAIPRSTMKLDGGVDFTVEATDWSPENIYIQSATLNGADYPKSYISHSDIMAGGTLTLQMGPEPNPDFGLAPENRPVNK